MNGVLPSHMYRDPLESAMRNEAKSCKGCIFIIELLGRVGCEKGKRGTSRCKHYNDEKPGGESV